MKMQSIKHSLIQITKGEKGNMSRVGLALICVLILLVASVPAVMAQADGENAAVIEVSKLDVQPSETTVGREVTITADIANEGNVTSLYTARLTINGQEIDSQDVSLAPGQMETVEFQFTPALEGTITIAIGEQQTSLEVTLASEAKFRTGPTVTLRPVIDEITASQHGVVELFISNPTVNDVTLNGDMTFSVPSGIHVYGQGFGMAGAAGTMYGQFSVTPGTAKTYYMNIKADETAVGKSFYIHFSGIYYPDDNKDAYNQISLTHPFTVKEASLAPLDPPDPNHIGGIWIGWWIIIGTVAFLGIVAIVAVWSRKTEVTIEK